MNTWIMDINHTKKRANQKYWDNSAAIWCIAPNALTQLEGKRSVISPRAAISRYIIRNVPTNYNSESIAKLWARLIVSTPFGIPKFEHDYNHIMQGWNENKSVSYMLMPEQQDLLHGSN